MHDIITDTHLFTFCERGTIGRYQRSGLDSISEGDYYIILDGVTIFYTPGTTNVARAGAT